MVLPTSLVSLLLLVLPVRHALCAPRLSGEDIREDELSQIQIQDQPQNTPTQLPWHYPLDAIYLPPNTQDHHPDVGNQKLDEEEEETNTTPSRYHSTLLARRLLALSSHGTLTTIFPSNISGIPAYSRTPSDVAGISIGLPEYIADCEDEGNPTIIALGVSTSTKNVELADTTHGRNVSLSISWWEQYHRIRGHDPWAVANLPRLSLMGYLEEISEEEVEDNGVVECFVAKHSDSRLWVPGTKGAAHMGKWMRVVVREVYWIGGFGGVNYIGWLDPEGWRGIKEKEWRKVRLRGES